MQYKIERCSLAQAGVRAEGVGAFLQAVEEEGYHLHSFMITRHGRIAYECSWAPYRLDEVHHMHSFTKGLTASAIGILEGEGRISLDDPVIFYFPECQLDDPDGRIGRMTIRHLLTMTSGHDSEPDRHGCQDESLAFLKTPMAYEPGTCFYYTSMGTNMLGAIVKKVTGFNLSRFLKVRLFDPMGIEGICFDTCTSGNDQGGGGSFLKTEDMAKITILYLQKGRWNGKQLIPEDWIDRMTAVQFAECSDRSNPDWEDWKLGYGYQVWMCTPPDTFRFDGLNGQFGIVFKNLDASVIMTCGECYTEAVLRLVWKYLTPAFVNTVPDDQTADEENLRLMGENLKIQWPMDHELSCDQADVCKKQLCGKTIHFPENEESVMPAGRRGNFFTSIWAEQRRNGIQTLRLRFGEENVTLDYDDNQNRGTLLVGMDGKPKRSLLRSLWGDYEVWTAARWQKDGSLELQVRPVIGEYFQVFTITREGDQISVHIVDGPWDRRRGVPEGRIYRCRLD